MTSQALERETVTPAVRSLLTPKQMAEQLNVTPSHLAKMRVKGGGPAFVKIGKCVRYLGEDRDAFIAAARRLSTADTSKAA